MSPWRDGRDRAHRGGPPDSPEGYGPPSSFDYPALWLQAGGAVLAVVSLVGYGAVLLALRGPGVVRRFVRIETVPEGFFITPDLFLLGVVFVAVVIGVPLAHEAVHGSVYRLLGYDVSYGVAPNVGGFYVAAFGQFQTRRANLLVGLAPLVLLTPFGVLGMAVGGPVVQATAYLGLVLNTAGAVGDLYLAARLVRMPPGTLMYEGTPPNAYVYEPLSGGAENGTGRSVT